MKTKSEYQNSMQLLLDNIAAIDAKATAERRDLTEGELSLKNEALDKVE